MPYYAGSLGPEEAWLKEYRDRQPTYEGFAQCLRRIIEPMLGQRFPAAQLESRVKAPGSFARKVRVKMKQGKYRNPIVDCEDLVGLRIILPYQDQIDLCAQELCTDFQEQSRVDHRGALDSQEFGYSSLHLVVALTDERRVVREFHAYAGLKAEIQIRTHLQHAWAAVEHQLQYKTQPASPNVARRFRRLMAILELCDEQFQLLRGGLNLRLNLLAAQGSGRGPAVSGPR